jgi:ankyrin repeat protein
MLEATRVNIPNIPCNLYEIALSEIQYADPFGADRIFDFIININSRSSLPGFNLLKKVFLHICTYIPGTTLYKISQIRDRLFEEDRRLMQSPASYMNTYRDYSYASYYNLVRAAIQQGKMQVNEIDEDGKTYLESACEDGNERMVQFLLENGIDIGKGEGDAALKIALSDPSRTNIAEMLVEKGVKFPEDIEMSKEYLCHAIRKGDTTIAKMLIAKGVHLKDWDTKKGSNDDPLYVACCEGDLEYGPLVIGGSRFTFEHRLEIIEELCKNKANPNFLHLGQRTCLHNVLDWRGRRDARDEEKEGRELKIAQLLIRNGANVNHCNHVGETPFLFAIQNGNIALVELMLKHRADVSQKVGIWRGGSYLEKLFRCENMDQSTKYSLVKLLVSNWPDIKDEHFINTLDNVFIYHASDEIVKFLISNWPDIQDEHLNKALDKAVCYQASDEIVQFLLEKGAQSEYEEIKLAYAHLLRKPPEAHK